VTHDHIVLGRDAEVLHETQVGIELISRRRLRPGFMVHLSSAVDPSRRPGSRAALVVSWWIRAVGSDGTTYRGFCRWAPPTGPALPAETGPPAETHGGR